MAKADKPSVDVIVPPHQFKFENGMQLRDSISGFVGFVVYRVNNLTGCDQYGLQPDSSDGTKADLQMIDGTRLTFTGVIKVLPITKVIEKPGGLSTPITHKKIK